VVGVAVVEVPNKFRVLAGAVDVVDPNMLELLGADVVAVPNKFEVLGADVVVAPKRLEVLGADVVAVPKRLVVLGAEVVAGANKEGVLSGADEASVIDELPNPEKDAEVFVFCAPKLPKVELNEVLVEVGPLKL
jgi:hypothetical protein